MKKIYQFFMLAMILFTVGCTQEDEIEDLTGFPSKGDKITISVGMPEDKDSRASYDDTAICLKWQEGDLLVAVGYDNQDNYIGEGTFVLKGSDGQATGLFVGNKIKGATKYQFYLKSRNLKLTQGLPTFTYNNSPQNGSGSTAHLSDCLFLQSDKLTEAQLSQAFKMKMLNAIVCITVKSIDPKVGPLAKITLETNSEDKNAPQTELLLKGTTGCPYTAYMCFDPHTMTLQKGKTFSLLFRGINEYKVSAKSETGKTYEAGHRYQVTVGEGGLTNWEEQQMVKVPVADTEFLIKSSSRPQWDPSWFKDPGNWTVSETENEYGYYSIQNGGEVITHIPANIFKLKAQDFQEILFPSTLKSIGEQSFWQCYSLMSVSFPEGLETIGESAFGDCQSLRYIKFPSSLKSIGSSAFFDCYTLQRIDNLQPNMNLGNGAFLDHALPSVILPTGTIDRGAFNYTFDKENESFEEYVVTDKCQILEMRLRPTPMRNFKVLHDAVVVIGPRIFAPIYDEDLKLANFYFWGSTKSTVTPGFVRTSLGGSFETVDLSLRVEWLNPGDDPEVVADPNNPRVFAHPAYTAAQRTPTPTMDADGKIIGGTWADVKWKSITFVDAQGKKVDPANYPALQGQNPWGTPKSTQP